MPSFARTAKPAPRTGRFLGVTYTYSGYPMVVEARARIAAGLLGKVRTVQVEYPLEWMATGVELKNNQQAAWRVDPLKNGRGGSIGDIGTHAYHLAGYVTGLKAQSVLADLATFVEGRALDDNAHVLIRYEGGARGKMLGLICQAWLGPAWRMTAQVNQVRPGGEAQQPHRDYHLGFQQGEFVAEFPIPAQILSQYLTLQGAVAHSDMPLASGPTRLLPFSHQYELGYMAYRQPEFVDYFNQHYVQLPLQKGDGLFFNPALFHAAGNNTTTDHVRTANLLQISSAFGVPMEDVNHELVLKKIYPQLQDGQYRAGDFQALIAVAARGYSFPTNLDTDPPLTPSETQSTRVQIPPS